MDRQVVEKDFVARTMHILDNYKGPYGVTLLINCLLGLIILPRERGFNNIAHQGGINFCDLGINPEQIKWGQIVEEEKTAARFLQSMRNSIAHIKIESISEHGEIEALCFRDQSGFQVILSVAELKEMVSRIAEFIH